MSNIGAKFYIGGRATPTVTDGRVYVAGKWGEVSCLVPHPKTLAKVRCSGRGISPEDQVRVPTWGFNESPLVLGDRLLHNAGSAGVALDLKTGKTLWKSADGEAGYPRRSP